MIYGGDAPIYQARSGNKFEATMHNRAPAVAGMFYPEDPARLAASVRGYLDESSRSGALTARKDAPKALILPHAGYQYSASIAASGYRLLEPAHRSISRVVLLGPAHRVYLRGMAVPSSAVFDFPGGSIPLDLQAIADICRLPGVQVSDEAHAQEHCLEVHLPFLHEVLDEFLLVPIVVGACSAADVARVIESLWGGDETAIVVSSDLSHYLPYEEARATDAQTSQAIAAASSALHGEQACGAHAINGLMQAAQRHGLQVDILDVRNSGDTAGDRSRVVGYGAYALR